MPIVWTKNFPNREKPLGYIRLLRARHRYFNRYAFVKGDGILPRWRQVPGYKHILNSWKNRHRGKRCFILGNGPSLNRMDLSPLKSEITIGTNAVYKNFPRWGWHVDYLIFEDIEQTELRRHDIPQIKGPVKLSGLHNAYAFRAGDDTYFMHVRNLDPQFVENQFPMFSEDFAHTVHLASTVTYIALQLAFHLGCDPVYLIGVDHDYGMLPKLYPPGKIAITEENYELIRGLHLRDDYYKPGDVIGVPPVEYMEAGYRKAREVFESHRRKIFNAGIDSKLKIFEPVEFHEIFESTATNPDRSRASSRPKVLIVTHDVGRLGAQISLLGLIEQWKNNQNWDFRIIAREPNGELMPDFQAHGPTSVFWPQGAQKKPGPHQRQIVNEILDWQPDLIYSNTAVNGDVLDCFASLAPIVVHVHEMQWYLKLLDESRRKAFVELPDFFIACSNAVKNNLMDAFKIPEAKITVIYEAVNCNKIRQKAGLRRPKDVRKELGIPPDAAVVGNCGRIDKRKGWDIFVDVADHVLKSAELNRDVYFIWVGHGPNRSDLLEEAKRRGISEKIKAPGPQENPFPYFKAMDIALVTSREDPFPLVVMEAALNECPVCAFEGSGGAPEFIRNDCGLLAPGFDAFAMADKIVQLIEDRELRIKLGNNAKRRAETEHDTPIVAHRLAQILKKRYELNASSNETISAIPELRLKFPDSDVGALKIRDKGAEKWEWEEWSAAKGVISIPEDKEVYFILKNGHARDISFLAKLPRQSINHLFLGRSGLTDEQLKHIFHFDELKTLDLRATCLTDKAVDWLRRLQALQAITLPAAISDEAIRTLKKHLPDCRVERSGEPTAQTRKPTSSNRKGARIIVFPEKSPGLLMYRAMGLTILNWIELGPARGKMNIPSNAELMLVVSRSGAENLETLKKLPPNALQAFHLRQTSINDEALEMLKHFSGIRYLDLRDTNISDACIAALFQFSDLKQLYLPVHISHHAVEQIKRKLPNCRVETG